MPAKWLQERAKGSKNEHGMPPHRAFCGARTCTKAGEGRSLCTGGLNAIRKHEYFLCSPFYGRACRWVMLGELKPKGPKGPQPLTPKQVWGSRGARGQAQGLFPPREREIFIYNLLVRVHLIIEMSRPALRHGRLNSPFQVALYLPSFFHPLSSHGPFKRFVLQY